MKPRVYLDSPGKTSSLFLLLTSPDVDRRVFVWVFFFFITCVFTHRITRVFTQLILLPHHYSGRFHHQFLKARRAERGALVLVRDQLGHRQFGAPVRRQLGFAPRGPGGSAKALEQRLSISACSRNCIRLLVTFKPGRRGAQIRL